MRPYLKTKQAKKKKNHKNRAGGVAQGESPDFKPWYHKKGEKKKKSITLGAIIIWLLLVFESDQ
jgi:hypothetical protein